MIDNHVHTVATAKSDGNENLFSISDKAAIQQIIDESRRQFGTCSVPYLMRRCKISAKAAGNYINNI